MIPVPELTSSSSYNETLRTDESLTGNNGTHRSIHDTINTNQSAEDKKSTKLKRQNLKDEKKFLDDHLMELQYLAQVLTQVDLFEDKKINDLEMVEVAKVLLLEKVKAKTVLCKYNSIWNKFYIILDGNVAIYKPIKEKIPEKEVEAQQKEVDEHQAEIDDLKMRV